MNVMVGGFNTYRIYSDLFLL